MTVETLIGELKKSNLYAECASCGEEFRISKCILFDGTKPFPKPALGTKTACEEELKQLQEDLANKIKLATKGAKKSATVINIGKSFEKIFPTLDNFKWELPDCRFLGDPLDFLIFNGYSRGNVTSIGFVEVKSGAARLNQHQKAIKDAVDDGNVSYKVID